ncbi:MAG TPA: glycoside hydrolase family 3 N-terminal domain-containing protein [Lacibacter sp.]|nr:glycoside hydrolase family 3 N-terminal domain-containing protein [Lacibacter sp.]HMO89318.1 glycoside hydrolase family 3 N-terminal domain-containing protein [Lacibacter sp.]HMP85883.1 glycoside hydrolase family 3 N-terminal domain-containing protein [Lacibacter sp.]
MNLLFDKIFSFDTARIAVLFFFLLIAFAVTAQKKKTLDQRVDSLLRLMTLEEKVGQLNQYTSDWKFTGPIRQDNNKVEQIRTGRVGSMLNVSGVEHTRMLQEHALQSRLKIPMLFGYDVIHGFRTTFPLPLAEAASWDLEAIERSARIAAVEASAAGIHWTFAPMVDISRDPRWGRVMEGAGEDPFLGSWIARARVKGFQGNGLGHTDAVMACAKHFAAYGAAIGGRDYNSVDMSPRMLWQYYLPPFQAAAEAGVATFMNSFNDLNGIPATGNRYLQRDILKKQWNFKGFVVSDWGSIAEMVDHGYAADSSEAALHGILAGSDMDMEGRCYHLHLADLVRQGRVPITLVDEAVRRILRKKFELGLFDDPFRFSKPERQEQYWNHPDHLDAARDMGRKSIVLLKNEGPVLPVAKQGKKIALIGPFVKAVRDNLGFWSLEWPDDSSRIVSLWQGVVNKLRGDGSLLYARGCNINDSGTAGFAEAVAVAQQSDVILLTVGEAHDMSGEAKSRSNIQLPGVQEELIKVLVATGKPVVLLVHAGRPLVFNWAADHVPAILYTWWLGTQAGNAIADVVFGDYNPSGKLPMTFPRSVGQVPIYYNHYNTGRPPEYENHSLYVTAYIDLPRSPRFPFGYGLSYTQFAYGPLVLSDTVLTGKQTLEASITVTNTGTITGKETVQLYIRDRVGKVVRPVKELKGFQQVQLKPGESKTVTFRITTSDLRFYDDQLRFDWEPGVFDIMIGGNSSDVQSKAVNWVR